MNGRNINAVNYITASLLMHVMAHPPHNRKVSGDDHQSFLPPPSPSLVLKNKQLNVPII